MVTKTRSWRDGVVLFMYLMLMGVKINGDDPCFGVFVCLTFVLTLPSVMLSSSWLSRRFVIASKSG